MYYKKGTLTKTGERQYAYGLDSYHYIHIFRAMGTRKWGSVLVKQRTHAWLPYSYNFGFGSRKKAIERFLDE